MSILYHPMRGRPDRPKWYALGKYRLYVNCISCLWKGRRVLHIAEPLPERDYPGAVDMNEAVRVVNEERDLGPCPKCDCKVIARKVGWHI